MNDPLKHADEINDQLDKILSHSLFRGAKRSCSFLKYVCAKVLEGNSYQIKEFSIAVDAFGLESTFDQQIDPRIRVEAKRLRDRLARYYEDPGKNDPLVISMVKGSYTPIFSFKRNETPEPAAITAEKKETLNILVDNRFNIQPLFRYEHLSDQITEWVMNFQSCFVHYLFEQSRPDLSSLSLSEMTVIQEKVFSLGLKVRFIPSGRNLIMNLQLLVLSSEMLINDRQVELTEADLNQKDGSRIAAENEVLNLLELCRGIKS